MAGGRPSKKDKIDLEQVKKMASIGHTHQSIADFFEISLNTLKANEEFLTHFKKGNAIMKDCLRAKQYELAMNGNTTMLVWMGKQHLDQSEKQEQKIDMKADVQSSQDDSIKELSPTELKSLIKEIKKRDKK